MHPEQITAFLDELVKIGSFPEYMLMKSLKNAPMIYHEKKRIEEIPDRYRRYQHALRENLPAGEVELEG